MRSSRKWTESILSSLASGVNLNIDERMFSKEIRSLATSMKKEMGRTFRERFFFNSLLQQLEKWYSIFLKEGSDVILRAWRDRAHIKGKRVKVTSFGETLAGIAIDVDSDGALILRKREWETKKSGRRRHGIQLKVKAESLRIAMTQYRHLNT